MQTLKSGLFGWWFKVPVKSYNHVETFNLSNHIVSLCRMDEKDNRKYFVINLTKSMGRV